jgi:hypothetical protein
MKIRSVGLSALVAVVALAVDVSASYATAAATPTPGPDPSKIGDNVKGIVEPNAKSFWWVALVVGLLFMAATRKGSRAGGMAAALVISGIVIYNPLGAASMMQGFAERVI